MTLTTDSGARHTTCTLDAAEPPGPTEAADLATRPPRATTHAAASARPHAAVRAVWCAFAWATFFTAMHGYWALGGRVGFGDQNDPLPAVTWDLAGITFTVVVGAMFAAGMAVPVALVRPWGRRIPGRLLVSLMWIGATILVVRGGLGFVDNVLRGFGVDNGLSGLSDEQALGSADPTAYTVWSSASIDACFLTGGLLFAWSAHRSRLASNRPATSAR